MAKGKRRIEPTRTFLASRLRYLRNVATDLEPSSAERVALVREQTRPIWEVWEELRSAWTCCPRGDAERDSDAAGGKGGPAGRRSLVGLRWAETEA